MSMWIVTAYSVGLFRLRFEVEAPDRDEAIRFCVERCDADGNSVEPDEEFIETEREDGWEAEEVATMQSDSTGAQGSPQDAASASSFPPLPCPTALGPPPPRAVAIPEGIERFYLEQIVELRQRLVIAETLLERARRNIQTDTMIKEDGCL
jgi:hypothetical protein